MTNKKTETKTVFLVKKFGKKTLHFLGPRGPLVEPSISPPVHPSTRPATIFPEFIDEL